MFGDVVEGDDLFRAVTLPKGWSKAATDHAMWSGVVDGRGVERVEVFYKAAFYDRAAHMRLARPGCRFASSYIYGDDPPAPVIPSVFNADELADVRAAAADYIARGAKHPDIYGDRVPRAQAILAALDAA